MSLWKLRVGAEAYYLAQVASGPAGAQEFKFSQPDDSERLEQEARQSRIAEQLSTPCRAEIKDKKIMVVIGELQPKAALDEAVLKVKDIMTKNGFYAGKDPMNFAATEPGFWMGKGKKTPV